MQTLQTHFYFDDTNKHSINLETFFTCERALHNSIKHLSKVLDIQLDVEICALQEGGVITDFIIKVKNNPQTTLAAIGLITAVLGNIISHQMTQDPELDNLMKESYYTELAESINTGERTLQQAVKYIEGLNVKRLCSYESKAVLKKQCSDFYSALKKDGNVSKISVTPAFNNVPINEDKHTVVRSNFDHFIREDDEIDRIDEYAEIEIVSPVIKKSKFPWRGIYDDKLIKFYMRDEIFKADVYKKLYSFKTGSRLYVSLTIISKVDDEGSIKDTRFIVTDVYGVYDPSTNQNKLTSKGEARTKEANFTPPTQPDFMLTQQEDI